MWVNKLTYDRKLHPWTFEPPSECWSLNNQFHMPHEICTIKSFINENQYWLISDSIYFQRSSLYAISLKSSCEILMRLEHSVIYQAFPHGSSPQKGSPQMSWLFKFDGGSHKGWFKILEKMYNKMCGTLTSAVPRTRWLRSEWDLNYLYPMSQDEVCSNITS